MAPGNICVIRWNRAQVVKGWEVESRVNSTRNLRGGESRRGALRGHSTRCGFYLECTGIPRSRRHWVVGLCVACHQLGASRREVDWQDQPALSKTTMWVTPPGTCHCCPHLVSACHTHTRKPHAIQESDPQQGLGQPTRETTVLNEAGHRGASPESFPMHPAWEGACRSLGYFGHVFGKSQRKEVILVPAAEKEPRGRPWAQRSTAVTFQGPELSDLPPWDPLTLLSCQAFLIWFCFVLRHNPVSRPPRKECTVSPKGPQW